MTRALCRYGLLIVLAATQVGCAAGLLLPAAGLANLVHKSGTMTVQLEGQHPIQAFQSAAVAQGGTVPIKHSDYARAEFSDVDIKIEAQAVGNNVTLRASSLSNVGRTYAMEDSMTIVTKAVAKRMEERGLRIIASRRDRM